jgi:transposase
MPYSPEFRRAVANAYDECQSSIEVAELFSCSESWVRRLIQRRRERGTLDPLPHRRPDTRKLAEDDLKQLADLIHKQPDLTLSELAEALQKKVSVPTIWRATQKLGLVLKKNATCRRAGSSRCQKSAGRVVREVLTSEGDGSGFP